MPQLLNSSATYPVTCACVCMRVCECVCECMRACVCVRVYESVCECMRACVCVRVYESVCMRACTDLAVPALRCTAEGHTGPRVIPPSRFRGRCLPFQKPKTVLSTKNGSSVNKNGSSVNKNGRGGAELGVDTPGTRAKLGAAVQRFNKPSFGIQISSRFTISRINSQWG